MMVKQFIFFSTLLLLFNPLWGNSKSRILVRSWAADDFVRDVDSKGRPTPQTCAYLEGEYYPDPLAPDEDPLSFEKVIEILSKEMMRENFVLDKPPEDAEYILLLNWGFTEELIPEDEFDMVVEEVLIDNGDGSFETSEIVSSLSMNTFSNVGVDNAQLIGTTSLLEMYPYSLKRRRLLEASEEKRLFVNLTAFLADDLKNLKNDKELSPRWISFFSIPFYDIDLNEAIEAISQAASGLMGMDGDTPRFINLNDLRYSTRPDALEFIGVEKDGE